MDFASKFHNTSSDVIYLESCEEYELHLLTVQLTGKVTKAWEDLETNVVYKLENVSKEYKCYNHLSDNIDDVRIITINDGSKEDKVLAPYAFIEHFFIIDILPQGKTVYFKKVNCQEVEWVYD